MNFLFLVILALNTLSTSDRIYKRQVEPTNLVAINRTSCVGPYFEPGECKHIRECQPLLKELKRIPDNKNFRQYLKDLNQLCENVEYHVCCEVEKSVTPVRLHFPKKTNEPPKQLLMPNEGCGYSLAVLTKVVSGNVRKVGDWPWVALIGYDDGLSSSPFKCDGTIITARHVITAAQCVNAKLIFVRVGEYDLNQEDEADYMDIKVTKIEIHPDYNPLNGRADIAILYLERNIDFSEIVSPICLPQMQNLLTKSYLNHNPFVVGWEKTRKGEKALQALQIHQITIHDNQYCKDIYLLGNHSIIDNQFDNATLCTGFHSHNKEECQGDAGSPLMMPEIFEGYMHYYLIGIASFSVKCSISESFVVYTNIRHFIDWIKEKIEQTL